MYIQIIVCCSNWSRVYMELSYILHFYFLCNNSSHKAAKKKRKKKRETYQLSLYGLVERNFVTKMTLPKTISIFFFYFVLYASGHVGFQCYVYFLGFNSPSYFRAHYEVMHDTHKHTCTTFSLLLFLSFPTILVAPNSLMDWPKPHSFGG